MRQMAPCWKATPGLTLVNQEILYRLPIVPYCALQLELTYLFDQVRSMDLAVKSFHRRSTRLTGLSILSLCWALRLGSKTTFVNKIPPCFSVARPELGFSLQGQLFLLFFLFSFHLLSFRIIYIYCYYYYY